METFIKHAITNYMEEKRKGRKIHMASVKGSPISPAFGSQEGLNKYVDKDSRQYVKRL